jgi:hypothetical protein
MLAFQNLPRTAFPIHIRAYKVDGSNEVVWETTIESRGSEAAIAFTIPALDKIHKCRIKIHVQWGNGSEKIAELG